MNTVGTFGVVGLVLLVSGGVGAGSVNTVLDGAQSNTWHTLVADDFHLEASGPAYREGPLSVSYFVPLAMFQCHGTRPRASAGRSQAGGSCQQFESHPDNCVC